MLACTRWWVRLGLLAICILGTIVLLPPARFLCLDDGFLHLFRLTELDWMIRGGLVYPRWASNLAYGYGYPLFNFYPPLAYYLTETLHILGWTIADAFQITLGLIVVLAAFGAYTLGRAWFDTAETALLVSAAYVFFPYFLLDVYQRGAVAEALAAAILPWLVWVLDRLIRQGEFHIFISTALIVAGFILAHNLTLLLSIPWLSAYLAWQIVHTPARWRAVQRVVTAVAIGIGLAAFYWLPMVSEMSLVLVSRSTRALTTSLNASFLALVQLVQFSFPYHYTDQPYPLSWLSCALAISALFVAWRQRAVWLWGALGLFYTILLFEGAREFWYALPILKTVQFAWRISIFIGLSVAMMAGALVNTVHPKWRAPLVIFLGLSLAWNALADLAPHRLDYPEGELSLGQMARFEINRRVLGFGSFAEYLPLTVQNLVTRLDARASAPAPQVTLESLRVQSVGLHVSTAQTQTLLLRTFYFPGWQATLDGEPLTLFPSTPLGLITFVVPPGSHRVQVEFGNTLPRQIGAWVSIVLGMTLLGTILYLVHQCVRGARVLVVLCAIVGVLTMPSVVLALTAPQLPLQSEGIDVTPALRLIGLRVQEAELVQNIWQVSPHRDVLVFQVIWFVRDQIGDQPFTWQLVSEDGHVWARRTQFSRFGTGVPQAWVANEIVADAFELPLDATIPPGTYHLQVGLGVTPRFVSVGKLTLVTPIRAPREPTMVHKIDARVGDHLRLLGANVPSRARPGDTVWVTLFWRAEQEVFEDLTVFVHMLDVHGRLITQHDGMPQADFLPTMLWHPGRIVADKHVLTIPHDVTPGVYRLSAGMYRSDTLERLSVDQTEESASIGEIKIPLTLTRQPRVTLSATLDAKIQLEGFDAIPRVRVGQPYTVTLYWRALVAPITDFTVFVHLLDANEHLIAQQDNAPRQNSYPTRIWDAGERVDDAYTFTVLTPGTYRIVAGMYDPHTGERVPILDAQGNSLLNRQIVITTFEVIGQ